MALSKEEIQWLSGNPEAIDSLQDYELSSSSMVRDSAALRQQWGEYARCLIELVSARRKLESKLPLSQFQSWILSEDAAQQATPMGVALYRAMELVKDSSRTSLVVADVTCSMGTELAFLALVSDLRDCHDALRDHYDAQSQCERQRSLYLLGADIDKARVSMAAHNISTITSSASSMVLCADAINPALCVQSVDIVIADPARRNERGRIKNPADLIPPLPDLIQVYAGAEMVIKCAPGLDYSFWEGQVDVYSVAGAVKEVSLVTPGLSSALKNSSRGRGEEEGDSGGEQHRQYRRAIVLPEWDNGQPLSWSTVEGYCASARVYDSSMPIPREQEDTAEVGNYIVEPDGAIIRAGLVQQFAASIQGWQIDRHIAYVTVQQCNYIPSGHRVFEVLGHYSLAQIGAHLRSQGVQRVEILVRGVDVDPDLLRKKWKLAKGKKTKPEKLNTKLRESSSSDLLYEDEQGRTVIIARVGSQAVAYECRAARKR